MNTTAVSFESKADRRWREWRLDYAASSRGATQIARVVFGFAFAAAVVWIGLQFVR